MAKKPNDVNVIAVIPARGGSRSVPSKNARLVAGKPLLAYTIEHAKKCELLDRIIVSTDDEAIADIAREHGAETPFIRPKDISGDLATTESALQHAVLWLDKNEGYNTDIVVFLACTVMFRKTEWITAAIEKLLEDPTLDSAFVVLKTHKNFWRRKDDQWTRLAPDIAYASRQVREPLYREETPSSCATRADLIRQGRRVGPNVDLVITEDERVMIDIHSEFDFWLVEKVLAEWPMDKRFE